MALLPSLDNSINRIYKAYEDKARADAPRTHLGASEIGRECSRQIWYQFRWIKNIEFNGRMLRLFDTGKLEENRLISDLNAIGSEVRAFDLKTGRQYRLDMFGGHFGGSLDGICIGVPEAPKTWHVLEMKTHNEKSFKSLVDKGVKVAKPEHYTQMQTYMGMSHETPFPGIPALTRAFYFAVNKNTDELYVERVQYDGADFIAIQEKARRIIFSSIAPPRISNKADFFQCRWCNFKENCHGSTDESTALDWQKPLKTCRSCIHSTPTEDGKWKCEKWNRILSPQEQRAACEKHLFLPSLIPMQQVDHTENSIIYQDSDGTMVTNYEGGELV